TLVELARQLAQRAAHLAVDRLEPGGRRIRPRPEERRARAPPESSEPGERERFEPLRRRERHDGPLDPLREGRFARTDERQGEVDVGGRERLAAAGLRDPEGQDGERVGGRRIGQQRDEEARAADRRAAGADRPRPARLRIMRNCRTIDSACSHREPPWTTGNNPPANILPARCWSPAAPATSARTPWSSWSARATRWWCSTTCRTHRAARSSVSSASRASGSRWWRATSATPPSCASCWRASASTPPCISPASRRSASRSPRPWNTTT